MLEIVQNIQQFEEDIPKYKEKLHVCKEIYKIQKIPEIAQKIAQFEEKLAKLQKLLCLHKKLQEIEYTDTPKKQYITESKLNETDLAYSEILNYVIKEQEKITSTGEKTKYRNLLRILLKLCSPTMSREEIEKHGNFNLLQTKENGKKGYRWCDDIQMSLQSKSATETLKGIVKMIKVSKFNIELSIKLKTGSIVHFKI